jgi:hypothetical protein
MRTTGIVLTVSGALSVPVAVMLILRDTDLGDARTVRRAFGTALFPVALVVGGILCIVFGGSGKGPRRSP